MIKTLKQKTYQRNKQNTIIKDTGWLQTATFTPAARKCRPDIYVKLKE